MLTMMGKELNIRHFEIFFFLIFPTKQASTFQANCLHSMKCQSLFSGEKKKDKKFSKKFSRQHFEYFFLIFPRKQVSLSLGYSILEMSRPIC